MDITREEFEARYFEELVKIRTKLQEGIATPQEEEDYSWATNAADNHLHMVVTKMTIAVIDTKVKSDWLKHNPVMRHAAKSLGITSSLQLREIAKNWE